MPILRQKEALSGIFTWNFGGADGNYVRVFFNHKASNMTFSYRYRGEFRRLVVGFEEIASNLGKGSLWYFVCPLTQKRCRKLYFIAGNFVHRAAYKHVYYENQTMSRRSRERDRYVSSILRLNKMHDGFFEKPMRISYGNKLTKRWARFLKYIHLQRSPSEMAFGEPRPFNY